MKKAYVLVFSSSLGAMEDVKEWADASPLVLTWRYEISNCFWLISENSAAELQAAIDAHFASKGRYLVTEISDNRQGRLTSEGWYLLRNKKAKPK